MKINFAVAGRCAIDPAEWNLPISNEQIFRILERNNFRFLGKPDIVKIARDGIGKCTYRRSARPSEAPEVVDCTSFIKWVYGYWGIWIPRRSVQQREFGNFINFSDLSPGDLVFTKGVISYYLNDTRDGVGHAGIYTERGTVIHAANRKIGVTETPLDNFMNLDNFRGVRRIVPKNREIITVVAPAEREIESSDDIKWVVVQSLS